MIPIGQVSGPQQLESDPLHTDHITLSPSFTEEGPGAAKKNEIRLT